MGNAIYAAEMMHVILIAGSWTKGEGRECKGIVLHEHMAGCEHLGMLVEKVLFELA